MTPHVISDIELFRTDVTTDEVKRLISEHPFIIDLTLSGYLFKCDDAVFMIHQLISLKKISICVKSRFEYDRLLNQMGNEWKNDSYFHDNIAYRGFKAVRLRRLDFD